MSIEIDNTYCEHIQIVTKLRNFCRDNYLKFEEDSFTGFIFTIRGIIPREPKGCIDEILYGSYDNIDLCDCSVSEKGILYIHFRKKASKIFMDGLVAMVDSEHIDAKIRYPCE
jgi:hypothetical protein